MKRQWLAGAWALLGAPAAIVLVGYSEKALSGSLFNGNALVIVLVFLPGACVGLGLLALLSLLKTGWLPRAIAAAVYGIVMCILAETLGNPTFATHAVLMDMPQ